MKIVSLLASGTEIVCALGLGDCLVGRSHECDNPSWVRSLPQCSEPAFDVSVSSREIDREVNRRIRSGEPLYTIDYDRIAQLAPDIIIAQQHCEVCAVTPGDLRPGISGKVVALSAFCLEDIFTSIRQVANAAGVSDACAEQVISAQRNRLDRVRGATEGLRHPPVVVLEWTDPLFSMGNWGPEVVEIAGGEPLLAAKGQHSRTIPAERLREADPEFLIVAPCGFDQARSEAERATLERLPWWSELTAVKTNRVFFGDGNLYFNRSGMTIARTAEIIAEILHGVSFPAD